MQSRDSPVRILSRTNRLINICHSGERIDSSSVDPCRFRRAQCQFECYLQSTRWHRFARCDEGEFTECLRQSPWIRMLTGVKGRRRQANRFRLSLGYYARARAIERTRNQRIRKSDDSTTLETRNRWIQNRTRESNVFLSFSRLRFAFISTDPITQERHAMLEFVDNAHKLQMKAQTTAEEAMNHLKIYMTEQEKLVTHCQSIFLLRRRARSILCRETASKIKKHRRWVCDDWRESIGEAWPSIV